jgi:hypothetical protein
VRVDLGGHAVHGSEYLPLGEIGLELEFMQADDGHDGR